MNPSANSNSINFLNPVSGRFIDVLKLNSYHFSQRNALSLNIGHDQYQYVTLNWKQYFHIVQAVSLFLIKSLPIEPSIERPVIGILSNSSSDYTFYNLALMNINATPLHLSTRLNEESYIALLEQASACGLIFSEEFFETGLSILNKISYPIELIPIQHLNYLTLANLPISWDDVDLLSKYTIHFNQIDELAYFVHSTGSTSLHPKLIPISNGVLLAQTSRCLSDTPEYPENGACLAILPLYHTGGQLFNLHRPIRWAEHAVAPPYLSRQVTGGPIILDLLHHVCFDRVVWLPKLLIELIDHCNSLPDALGWQHLIQWDGLNQVGGAALPLEYRLQLLERGIRLQQLFGSSEVGIFGYSGVATASDNPGHLFFSKDLSYHWDPYDVEENIFELIICSEEQSLFDRREDYHTKDLFKVIEWKCHAVYEFQSRADDVLVHVTGEKTNPIPMEDKLNECIVIRRSVILGRNHTLNHVIIELEWHQVAVVGMDRTMQLVQDQVKLVNATSPSHSRLVVGCVHVLKKSQEILVSVKGNVLRQANLKQFEHLTRDIQFELPPSPPEIVPTSHRISEIVSESLNLNRTIHPNDDFFELGLDSLSGLVIVKKIQRLFPEKSLNVNNIYQLRNIKNLVDYIEDNVEIKQNTIESVQQRVDCLIKKYTSRLDKFQPIISKPNNSSNRIVLVVGSNGSLACHLIHALLQRPDVTQVIGLVRGKVFEDKLDYQVAIMQEKGLDIDDHLISKLKCVSANLLQHNFNLPQDIFQNLLAQTTEVVQVGWRMNFLNDLEDFEDCIETTSNLLEFCLINSKYPKIFEFVSTIVTTIPTYQPEYTGLIPETPTSGQVTSLNGCTGYGLSKLVSEQICYHAARTKGVPVKVFRVGELSGDQSLGQWNVKEFLPLMIRTIVKLKSYPNLDSKSISWVPIDIAGKSLADLSNCITNYIDMYCIVNPQTSKWTTVIESMKEQLGIQLNEISLPHFLELLSDSASEQSNEVDLAQGLEQFLGSYLQENDIHISWDVEKTCKLTSYMKSCPPIDNLLLSKYIDNWNQIDYFN